MKYEGTIRRANSGEIIVRAPDSKWALDYGAVCINPKAPEAERIYEKVFEKKPIFLPSEYDKAMKLITHRDGFTLSMNGYSSLSAEKLARYAIQEGAYEEACMAILRSAIDRLREEFPGSRLFLTYGTSPMGVDGAIEQVARESAYNIDLMGFSCPRYMLFAEDNDIPVYVAATQNEYADAYIRSLDLLINTGGRAQSLQHDILAACLYQKRIHFVDVMNLLSKNNIPATIIDADGRVQVENAPAAFGHNISFCSAYDAIQNIPADGDKWNALFNNVSSVAVQVCRDRMPADKKFQHKTKS